MSETIFLLLGMLLGVMSTMVVYLLRWRRQ